MTRREVNHQGDRQATELGSSGRDCGRHATPREIRWRVKQYGLDAVMDRRGGQAWRKRILAGTWTKSGVAVLARGWPPA
jgi:hypothetical protein